MQRLLWILLLTVFPACAQTGLVFTWQPNPSNADRWPPCRKLVKTMCRTGYTLIDATNSSAPLVISSTIAPDATSYTVIPLPSAGVHVYDLVVDARVGRKGSVQSSPATVTVVVPDMFSNPPAGFEAKATPAAILFTWLGPKVNVPACGREHKVACLIAYSLSDVTNPSQPVSISSDIAGVLTFNLNRLPPPGQHAYSLVVNGRDQNGLVRSSAPAVATVIVNGDH